MSDELTKAAACGDVFAMIFLILLHSSLAGGIVCCYYLISLKSLPLATHKLRLILGIMLKLGSQRVFTQTAEVKIGTAPSANIILITQSLLFLLHLSIQIG